MNYLDILRAQLRVDEGDVPHAYQDSEGYWTIGVGHLIDARKGGKISSAVIEIILDEDIAEAEADARSLLLNFDGLSEVRKAVVANMAFQLGRQNLSEFQNTLRNIREGRWDDAAIAMLASKVAREQAQARWARHAEAMREG